MTEITPEDPCPIDPKALDMIASLQPQGTDSVLRKVITLYLDGSRKLMKSIRESAEGSDADALHHAAHTLKSSSAYLGAMTLSGMCKELEGMAQDKVLGGTTTRLPALEQEYERVYASLKKRLESEASGGDLPR